MDSKELRNGIRELVKSSGVDGEEKEKLKTFLGEMLKSKEAWIEFISNVMGQVPEYMAEMVTDDKFHEFRKIVLEELK